MTQPIQARPPGPPTQVARKGWYRDPWQRDSVRYWDGWQWTPRVRPLQPVTLVTYPRGDTFTNAMLTVVTCGLWAPVWMLRSSARHKVRKRRQ
jgi:hypothetical protein